MEYDLEFARKLECSEDDKRDCLKLVENLLSLSKKARTYGMLSLAKEAEENSSFLLTKGIQLATDGAKPHVVRSILEFYILSGNYVGKELLERCLILEGIVAIQEGLHPKLLKELLLSLNETSKPSLTEYLGKIKNTQAGSENAKKLSNYILKLNDGAIEELLKELDTSNLAKAIQNMSGVQSGQSHSKYERRRSIKNIQKNAKKGGVTTKRNLRANGAPIQKSNY
jgi:hypothetical protein